MTTPANPQVSVVDDVLTALKNGYPPEKISLSFPWTMLSEQQRKQLIEKASGHSYQARQLLRLLAVMVEDVPVEFRWDQMDILMAGFQYLGWDDLQKQIALSKMEMALSDIAQLAGQQPGLRKAFNRYKAYFHQLRGKYFFGKTEYLRASEEFEQAAENFRQAGSSIEADKINFITAALRKWLQGQHRPLEVSISDEFLFNYLRNEERQLLGQLATRQQELRQVEDDIQSKTSQLQALEQRIEQQQSAVSLLQQEIQAAKLYRDFLLELRDHAMAPLWMQIVRRALSHQNMNDLAEAAMQQLKAYSQDANLQLLYHVLIRAAGYDPQVAGQITQAIGQIRQGATAEKMPAAAEVLLTGWEQFLDALEKDYRLREAEEGDFEI